MKYLYSFYDCIAFFSYFFFFQRLWNKHTVLILFFQKIWLLVSPHRSSSERREDTHILHSITLTHGRTWDVSEKERREKMCCVIDCLREEQLRIPIRWEWHRSGILLCTFVVCFTPLHFLYTTPFVVPMISCTTVVVFNY